MLAAQRNSLMRRYVVIACIWWMAACAAPPVDNDPLVFGMTKDEVEHVLGAPLIYLKGPRGSERYMVQTMSSVPGIYPADTRVILQFRRNRLTGWRRDWQMRPFKL
jgi:hypothetical protein